MKSNNLFIILIYIDLFVSINIKLKSNINFPKKTLGTLYNIQPFFILGCVRFNLNSSLRCMCFYFKYAMFTNNKIIIIAK